jgi:hypothetical protein
MKSFTHLGIYAPEQIIDYDRLLEQSVERLPFTLASPVRNWKQRVHSGDYDRAANYLLDFFETGIQYLSCVLIAFMRAEGDSDVGKEVLATVVNKIDNKRPLSFGDWVNDIFIPLANTAVRRIPSNPLVESISSHILDKKAVLLLGNNKNIRGIVQIRNNYRGHTTTLSSTFYEELNRSLEPRLYRMLQGIAPLRDWDYFLCQTQQPDGICQISQLNGSGEFIHRTIVSAIPVEPSHYYIGYKQSNGTPVTIDVFPLVSCNEDGYVYVFQTLREDSISYVSSHENAPNLNEKRWNKALDRYMHFFQPSFDVSRELNYNQIRDLVTTASKKFIDNAYKEKKYNKELFVDREELSRYFDDFCKSNKNLFPLLGEAGQGKTNQLCYWTEKLIEQGKTVLIFNSSGFSTATLEEKLKNVFSVTPRHSIQKLLDNIENKNSAVGEYIYIFFDALNECISYKGLERETQDPPLALYRDICSLLSGKNHSRFKVLFTCRNYTWKNLIQPEVGEEGNEMFRMSDHEQITVKGFTDDELEQAYSIYRELYQMETDFDKLERRSKIRLKDPLSLKIACTNYLGSEFPTSTLPYTSISLFEKMLDDISHSYAGNGQCHILKEMALYILQEYEKGVPSDSISIASLREAYDRQESPLYRMSQSVFKKDGISVAYSELLNKPERPVLRLVEEEESGKGRIQFIYERFLEYMLALVFTERESDRTNLSGVPISASTYIEELSRSGISVVLMGAMRNALIMDYLRTKDYAVILSLAREFGEQGNVMSLVVETMNSLIHENYEDEVFGLMDRLLDGQQSDEKTIVTQFNNLKKKIASNQANDTIIGKHNELAKKMAPTIRLRQLALIGTINGIFMTDFFNENLYQNKPFKLLWRLMTDTIDDVSNNACLYVYYLSNKTHTLGYTQLGENLTEKILRKMFAELKQTPVYKFVFFKSDRDRSLVFLETSIRIAALLIIDASMSGKANKGARIGAILKEVKTVLKHFTWNFNLIRLMMPLFSTVLRKQLTFQSVYVNNIIEYHTFWDEDVVPSVSVEGGWSKECLTSLFPFIFHYERYFKIGATEDRVDMPDFTTCYKWILSAYKLGDSFSYFILERLLVIVGTCSWEYVSPIVTQFFKDEYRQGEWFDYSQMSMLYVLCQLAVHSPIQNDKILTIFSRECEDWTNRCKGQFRGRNSHKANPSMYYKRNVMNWYCVVYCHHTGDAVPHLGDEQCVPVFYRMIDRAFEHNDKELLFHLVDNISELITDSKYIHTALGLLKYILLQLDSVEKIERLDKIVLNRTGFYQDDIITLCGRVLGTAKNYFPAETDNFIKKDMVGMKFPGAIRYREEILNYNLGGELLSDLFTHKFGNFLMWSLLHEEAVETFASEAIATVTNSKDVFKWFDQVIRLSFLKLFEVKL